MAQAVGPRSIARVALSATPNNALQLDVANGVRSVEIRFFDAAGVAYVAGKLAVTGTDGAAMGAAFLSIGEGELYRVLVEPGGAGSLFVASSTASAIVEIVGWAS